MSYISIGLTITIAFSGYGDQGFYIGLSIIVLLQILYVYFYSKKYPKLFWAWGVLCFLPWLMFHVLETRWNFLYLISQYLVLFVFGLFGKYKSK